MALNAALSDPTLVWEAMQRRGVEGVEAAFMVADAYHRMTGQLPETGDG